MLRRLVSHFALALLLVFAQQQSSLHQLAHGFEDIAAKKAGGAPAGEHTCEKCVALAHLDHAAAPALAPVLFAPAAVIAPSTAAPVGAQRRFVAAYRSRAPPETT